MNQSSDLAPTCETGNDTSTVPNVAHGTDHLESIDAGSIIDRAEKALRVFEGEPLTRAQAERLLSMWIQRDELSDGDWAAVLDRFGEDIDGDADDVSIEETMAALRRLDERLRATGNTEVYMLGVREGERRAGLGNLDEQKQESYARGLVDAFSAVLEPEPLALRYTDDGSTAMTDLERAIEYRDYLRGWVTRHAWIVRAIEGASGSFLWTCSCGGVAIQEPGEGGAAVIRAKLDAAHIEAGKSS